MTPEVTKTVLYFNFLHHCSCYTGLAFLGTRVSLIIFFSRLRLKKILVKLT
jgi:hypothetical protein